jgi:hypothetical protein
MAEKRQKTRFGPQKRRRNAAQSRGPIRQASGSNPTFPKSSAIFLCKRHAKNLGVDFPAEKPVCPRRPLG